MGFLSGLEAQSVPVFETFVVPRYLATYGLTTLELLIPCENALLAPIGCRTGFPDEVICRCMPGATVVGFDPSEPALELARTKGALLHEVEFDYRMTEEIPLDVPEMSFTHALSIVPLLGPEQRVMLLQEMYRVLAPGGQALFSLPLRGSFQEVSDLLREYALKHDIGEVTKALEANINARPTVETLCEGLEDAGFEEVDVEVRPMTLSFSSGRDFMEDPTSRLMVIPDLELSLGISDLVAPMKYVREAIDLYWSEGDFELTVNVGCASARRL
jgi:SAM-dependent methyltransferase